MRKMKMEMKCGCAEERGLPWKPLLLLLVVVGVVCGGAGLLWRRGGAAFPPQVEQDGGATDVQSMLGEAISKSKAVFHLEGFCGEDPGLVWTSQQGQAFIQGGFVLTHNTVLVPHSGLYFVYSQASFRLTCRHDDQPRPISHRIWSWSESVGTNVTLVGVVRSVCGHSALYLGGAFRLRRGDRLWTETRPVDDVMDADEGRNFFGAFAL